ncbi:MAG: adenosylcobinamide-phosphate synthase CbiB [Pseudomonadota bacterium]
MFSLALALILDAIFGEPRWLWSRLPHPTVMIGHVIGWGDITFNRGRGRKLKGLAFLLALSAIALLVGWGIARLPFGVFWETLVAAILLAQRSLSQHVLAVANGLYLSLQEGRAAVAMIVGRDTKHMTTTSISRAAIESAGENFSDGVIAPAFWFAVLGLPGMIFYKAINTADSMIGHRTPRYAEFGWASARLDDLVNWAPARLSALLIALSQADFGAWRRAKEEGPRHRSPNAGWPEAALAHALNVAVSGPRDYAGHTENHPLVNGTGRLEAGPGDIETAMDVLWGSWACFLTIVTIIGLGTLILD